MACLLSPGIRIKSAMMKLFDSLFVIHYGRVSFRLIHLVALAKSLYKKVVGFFIDELAINAFGICQLLRSVCCGLEISEDCPPFKYFFLACKVLYRTFTSLIQGKNCNKDTLIFRPWQSIIKFGFGFAQKGALFNSFLIVNLPVLSTGWLWFRGLVENPC